MQPKNNQNQTVVPVENRKINLDIMKPNLKHQTILWDIASQNYIETSLQHCHEHLISSYQQDNIHTYIRTYTCTHIYLGSWTLLRTRTNCHSVNILLQHCISMFILLLTRCGLKSGLENFSYIYIYTRACA